MDASSWVIGVVFGSVLLAAVGSLPASDLYDVDVKQLAELWEKEHVSPSDPGSLKHLVLKQRLHALRSDFPQTFRLEQVGNSIRGREIYLATLGTGPEKILLWSQMHGDEPTATGSLLDLFHFLCRRRGEPWVGAMLEKYTLLCIPMLNPDGAELGQRRNAQEIDINRDARALQTPEGRILKFVRDRHAPFLGFNLHNQNSLTTVGDTGKVATIALLAVGTDGTPGPADEASSSLTKRVSAVLYDALSPFAYGHISRYDESYNPRAFGDNLSRWGTPVVLIESGGYSSDQGPGFPVMLNFVGILAVLNSLSTGRIANANPAVFDALKMNSDTPIFDILLRNAWIYLGDQTSVFKGDMAIRGDARSGSKGDAIIADIGDLGIYTAHQTIDCTGSLVTPGLIAWNPETAETTDAAADEAYLRRGILTVLQSVPGNNLPARSPDSANLNPEGRMVNWGFLVTGAPSGAGPGWELLLAEWFAAGARGWVLGPETDDPARSFRVPRWFGMDALTREEAERYRAPSSLSGDPAKTLPRWTSEAARRFRIPRRGTIAPGAIADLVIWSTPSAGAPPSDLGRCKPVRVMIGGDVIDLVRPVDSRRESFSAGSHLHFRVNDASRCSAASWTYSADADETRKLFAIMEKARVSPSAVRTYPDRERTWAIVPVLARTLFSARVPFIRPAIVPSAPAMGSAS